MNNEITIDIEEIRKLPDGSVTDCETIRQISYLYLYGYITQLVRVANSKLVSRGFEPHYTLKLK